MSKLSTLICGRDKRRGIKFGTSSKLLWSGRDSDASLTRICIKSTSSWMIWAANCPPWKASMAPPLLRPKSLHRPSFNLRKPSRYVTLSMVPAVWKISMGNFTFPFDSNSDINIMDVNCCYVILIGIEFGIVLSLKSGTVLYYWIVKFGIGFNGRTRKRNWDRA